MNNRKSKSYRQHYAKNREELVERRIYNRNNKNNGCTKNSDNNGINRKFNRVLEHSTTFWI